MAPEVLHARPAEGCRRKPNVDGIYRRWAWHVPIKAYTTTHGDEWTIVDLMAVEFTPAACDDVIVTSSHRQCMSEHVDRVWGHPSSPSSTKRGRGMQVSIIAAYTSKFDPRYLGPGSSDRHEFSPRNSPRWDKVRCEVWSLSTERKKFYARGYFDIYGVYLFYGSRHGTSPENFGVGRSAINSARP
jgi:hypothetical protein